MIVAKLSKTIQEIRILIDGLGNISTTRHFQNYFDELFEKLNFLYDVKINLKEYYPQDDIFKVETLLKDQISVFFMVLDTNELLYKMYCYTNGVKTNFT